MKRLVEKDRHTVSEGWTPAGKRAAFTIKGHGLFVHKWWLSLG